MTKQQVKDSPEINTDRPVSRQMETDVYDYYGWHPYWGNGFMMGGYGYGYGYWGSAMAVSPYEESRRREEHLAETRRRDEDPHLRSINAITGYYIHARDGEVGHVEDLLVDDTDWSIHYLVVDTKNWWPGKKVLISPAFAREIDWSDKLVHLDIDRQKVKDSPGYDASTVVDRTYEKRLHGYYGDVRPGNRADGGPLQSRVGRR